MIWYRPRTLRLFGFTQVFEAYKPAARRRHGYYVCPLLADGRLIGAAGWLGVPTLQQTNHRAPARAGNAHHRVPDGRDAPGLRRRGRPRRRVAHRGRRPGRPCSLGARSCGSCRGAHQLDRNPRSGTSGARTGTDGRLREHSMTSHAPGPYRLHQPRIGHATRTRPYEDPPRRAERSPPSPRSDSW
ncbi:hypothetical protein [Streptomyces anulatus]|uniref:hypothetical protein n=1 Tax=Streptomyces anulatus TaxID=1892 RepID=UPI003F4D4048